MSEVKARIVAMRKEMSAAKVDAYYIPSVDPHQSEYVPECWQRRPWISGFSGSAGDVLVTQKMAGLWTDGRYFIQAERELAGSSITLFRQGKKGVPSLAEWIAANLRPGQLLGADPRLLSKAIFSQLDAAVRSAGGKLKLVERNLVDAIWEDAPAPPKTPIEVHPARYAGESIARKLGRVRAQLKQAKADALVLTTLDAVAWAFNIRGRDVPHNPVAIAYGLVTKDAAQLYCSPEKVTPALEKALGKNVAILPYAEFASGLAALNDKKKRVWVDPQTVNAWVLSKLRRATLHEAPSPVVVMKARKNAKELAGAQRAHIRDGVAMVRFLRWLEEAVPQGEVTETGATDRLAAFRAEGDLYRGESFGPISGYRGHGAIVHYSATKDTASVLRANGIYLIDSGGQYTDGTTDITRTVLLGERATREQRDRFTRVLKGHIAIATTVFPANTPGRAIDAFARRALWDAGLDYAHGTGHGVGSYLNVHEGPISINPNRCTGAPLEEGNILSNEPGYYKEGHYGIRIENLVVVKKDPKRSSERGPFYCFEELTLCPIDTRLVETKLLSAAERGWLNRYHKRVRTTLLPLLPAAEQRWLKKATRAI